MKRWFVLLAPIILTVAGYTIWRHATADEGMPDEVRIRQVLADGQQGITVKDLRAAMECVSQDYRDANGMTKETLRLHALHAMRTVSGYEIRLDAPIIRLESEGEALVEARVEVVTYSTELSSNAVSFELVLDMAKENERRWGVFPITRWRVTSVSGLPIARLQDL